MMIELDAAESNDDDRDRSTRMEIYLLRTKFKLKIQRPSFVFRFLISRCFPFIHYGTEYRPSFHSFLVLAAFLSFFVHYGFQHRAPFLRTQS